MADDRLVPVPGFEGIYTRTLVKDVSFYVSLKKPDGKRTFRSVGRKSQGMNPKAAVARQAALQSDLDRSQDPKLRDAFTFGQAYLAYLRKKRARDSNTVRDEGRWDIYLKPYAGYPCALLATSDFEELLIRLRAKGLSEGYLEKILGQARTIFSWAIKDNLWDGKNPLGDDSSFSMPTWRKSGRPTKWFTPEEAKKVLDALRARSEHWYNMAYLSLRTGMRAHEIWGLGDEDDALDEVNGRLNFRAKDGSREWVEADKDLFAMLREYDRAPGEYIFQKRNGGRIYKTSKTHWRVLRDCGMLSDTHKTWFHSWRHTFGSWLAQSGKWTLQEIMQVMRHKDERMTLHYAQLIPGGKVKRLGLIRDQLSGQDEQVTAKPKGKVVQLLPRAVKP